MHLISLKLGVVMLEYIILGFLLSKDLTGYDLKQRMAKSTSFFFDASFGSIYPALKRLEAKKYTQRTSNCQPNTFIRSCEALPKRIKRRKAGVRLYSRFYIL